MHWLMNSIHAVCVLLSPALKPILASTFGSVDKMIQGKKYPQNFRALRLLAEVMLQGILDSNPNICTMEQLIQYLEDKSTNSKTMKLWVDCLIKPVFIWCAFIRAAREQDLPLHHASAKAMLPYYPSGHGRWYTRYGTFYVHHLEILPHEVCKKLMHDCSLRVSEGVFNAIHTDQFIETTYMRLGHGPGGAKGLTINQKQMEVWALSFATCGEVTQNLKTMTNSAENQAVYHHKEESVQRIMGDKADRDSLRRYLSKIVDPLDPSSHPGGHLMNIVSGEIAPENVNVHEAISKGKEVIKKFKESWPSGFYQTISQPVITMDTTKKFVKIGEHRVYDQSFIYARIYGLMASNRDIKMEDCLATEMAANPPGYFDEEGKMRSTPKAKLMAALAIRISERLATKCDLLIFDVSALLWTICWPNEGCPLQTYIKAFQEFAMAALATASVVFAFDRYFPNSTKAHTRILRQEGDGTSRSHVLTPDMLNLPRTCILKVTKNKEQLNKMLSDSLLEPDFYKLATKKGNTMTIVGVENHPIEITNGIRIDRADIKACHEEADLLIAQQAILASENNQTVSVISDDTDVFVLLLHFYVAHKCTANMYMSSPKNQAERTVIDIKKTAKRHESLSQYILQVHALTGADTIAAHFRIGKKRALNTLTSFNEKDAPPKKDGKKKKATANTKGFFDPKVLEPVGDLNADISSVISVASQFHIACYGKQYMACKTMTEARIKVWRKKIASGVVKLSELPPTNEAAGENIRRAHYQIAHWKTAVTGVPPDICPTDYGYETKLTASGSIVVPRTVPPGTKDAPDKVRDMIHCGCEVSECKGDICRCRSIGCTIFCKCEAGPNCKNPLTKIHMENTDGTEQTEEADEEE